MPAKIFPAKDNRLPSFVLPEFDYGIESFYPFIRLSEPQDTSQIMKKIVLTLTIFPLRLMYTLVFLPMFAIIAIIGKINYDPTDLNDLSEPLPIRFNSAGRALSSIASADCSAISARSNAAFALSISSCGD